MKQWYCHVGGQQYGPISEEVLRAWMAEGRVKPTDLVWTEGMAQWQPAAGVPGLMASVGMPTLSMAGVAPPGGTGGLTPNKELMRQAREILRGHWGEAIGFSVLYMLLTMGMQMVPYIGGCIAMVLGGAFELGMVIFFLAFTRRGARSLDMLFRGFRQFGNALCAYLLRAVFVGLWLLGALLPGAIIGLIVGLSMRSPEWGIGVGLVLGLIPGMIAAWIAQLGYALTFYLLADDPTLGPVEPIMMSYRMMRGYKAKLFCLMLRFFGWAILSVLSCFIGFLWLVPYIQVSMARFYDDVRAASAAVQPTAAAPWSDPAAPPMAQPL